MEIVKLIISNAFSINMLNFEEGSVDVNIIKVDPEVARKIVELTRNGGEIISAVGHEDVAAIFSDVLNFDVAVNRINVELNFETTLLVGQYKGPRLPEGASKLPENARIEWFLVELF